MYLQAQGCAGDAVRASNRSLSLHRSGQWKYEYFHSPGRLIYFRRVVVAVACVDMSVPGVGALKSTLTPTPFPTADDSFQSITGPLFGQKRAAVEPPAAIPVMPVAPVLIPSVQKAAAPAPAQVVQVPHQSNGTSTKGQFASEH